MLLDFVVPDKFTYSFAIKACARVRVLEEAEQIHCRIRKSPHQLDLFVRNSLIVMYVKCGEISDARVLFDEMPNRNSVCCWNVMIDGYVKCGKIEAARGLFDRMPHRDLVSWNVMVDGYGKCGAIEVARQLFDEMPARDMITWNIMIDGYVKNGNMGAAKDLFDQMPLRDVVTWGTMVNGYAKCGRIEIARCLFERMPYKSLISWNSMVDGYAKCGDIEAAQEMFERMPQRTLTSWNAILDAYAKSREIESARLFFDKMPVKDVFSWNIMIDGYARVAQMDVARDLFNVMPIKDIVSWNVLLAGYKNSGRSKEAVELFRHMQMVGERPDCSTLVVVLSATADLGLFSQGRWIHAYIDKNKISLYGIIGVALIDMYSKCGNVDIAFEVFQSISRKSTDHWNSIISGLALHGYGNRALCLLEEMLKSTTKPDDITFIGFLNACSHSGLVCEGRQYFKLMSLKYNITPKIQHYGCMVDLLSRAGHLEEAMALVNNMPMRPNDVVWRALLGASRIHNNIEIGGLAAKRLMELVPYDTSSYVLLSIIYGSMAQWENATEMWKMMKERGIAKVPGCSSIEVNGVVHEFTVGDTSHPQIMGIHLLLNEMAQGLMLAGYEPGTKLSLFDTDV